MLRKLAMALALVLASTLSIGSAGAAYPDRPLTLIVPWAAGGGTDATARIVATLLEKELGQPVNVVNRTGGSGVVGHSAIATAAPDGYTIGMITVEIVMMHWQKLTDLTYASYTPLGQFNVDPAGVQVASDSPYKDLKSLLAAIKAEPGKFKASGTGQGGIWHLALAGMLESVSLKSDAVPWVPSQGAAPAMQDLAAGGIQVVTCSVPEARAMIEAGKARSLAVMGDARNPQFPDVPTLKEASGSEWTIGAWRGIAGPKGMPKEAVDKLVPALKKVYESKEYKDFMSGRGFGVMWREPQAFFDFMAKEDASMGKVMKAVGIVQ